MGVVLRPLRDEDAVPIFEMMKDRAILESMLWNDELNTLEDIRAFIFFAGGKGSSGRDMAIDCGGEIVGCMKMSYCEGVFAGSAEIGYWIGKEFRNKGYATSAIDQAQSFLFEKRSMRRVFARVSADNIASRSALERSGFFCEAILRHALIIDGEVRDCAIYAKLKSQSASLHES